MYSAHEDRCSCPDHSHRTNNLIVSGRDLGNGGTIGSSVSETVGGGSDGTTVNGGGDGSSVGGSGDNGLGVHRGGEVLGHGGVRGDNGGSGDLSDGGTVGSSVAETVGGGGKTVGGGGDGSSVGGGGETDSVSGGGDGSSVSGGGDGTVAADNTGVSSGNSGDEDGDLLWREIPKLDFEGMSRWFIRWGEVTVFRGLTANMFDVFSLLL